MKTQEIPSIRVVFLQKAIDQIKELRAAYPKESDVYEKTAWALTTLINCKLELENSNK